MCAFRQTENETGAIVKASIVKGVLMNTAHESPLAITSSDAADGRVSLLGEVDFKWLMAGQGWWVDTTRLHCDPAYASTLIDIALASPSPALRRSAAMIGR
jgi:hypothetical protein